MRKIKDVLRLKYEASLSCRKIAASLKLPDWIGSHVRAFEFFGCVPEIVAPDNLKSAVTKPCRYEPEFNATYADMAQHYGAAIIPARPCKPRDKAMVELGVLRVKRRAKLSRSGVETASNGFHPSV